jgi:hypothetical protein
MVRFGIVPIHGHLFWRMSWIIDLQAIYGDLPSEFVEQLAIIADLATEGLQIPAVTLTDRIQTRIE